MFRINSPRRIAAAAALACAALLAPAVALAAPASPAKQAAPATAFCETPGLVIWLNTEGNGYAGGSVYTLNFTNLSGHSCTLNGFPFLYAVNLKGHQVGKRASFTGKAHSVTVGKGKTATAHLTVVDVGNFPASSCKPTTAAGFKVFPPNQTTAKTVPFPFGACQSTKVKFLSVTAVK